MPKNPPSETPDAIEIDHLADVKIYNKSGELVLPEQVTFNVRECTIFCARHGESWRAKVSINSKHYGHYCEVCDMNSGLEV